MQDSGKQNCKHHTLVLPSVVSQKIDYKMEFWTYVVYSGMQLGERGLRRGVGILLRDRGKQDWGKEGLNFAI